MKMRLIIMEILNPPDGPLCREKKNRSKKYRYFRETFTLNEFLIVFICEIERKFLELLIIFIIVFSITKILSNHFDFISD